MMFELKPENIHQDKFDKSEQAKFSTFDNIQQQRHKQRAILFALAVKLTYFISFILLSVCSVMVFWSQLLRSEVLIVLIISSLASIVGILKIIAKAIWNDYTYRDMLQFDQQNIHKENSKKTH